MFNITHTTFYKVMCDKDEDYWLIIDNKPVWILEHRVTKGHVNEWELISCAWREKYGPLIEVTKLEFLLASGYDLETLTKNLLESRMQHATGIGYW